MRLKLSNLPLYLWLFVCIPLLSFIVLHKTFHLALYGDDWLQLYDLWYEFDVTKHLSFFSITSYLNPYWPQYFFLGIIRNFFGYASVAYFGFSLVLRILANISIYFFVHKLTKSKTAAICATVIFLFSLAGLETTDWVFNMNSYAGILFLHIALVFFLILRSGKNIRGLFWYYLGFAGSFLLALGIVPVRMHAAALFVIATDVLLLLFVDKKKEYVPFLIRSIVTIGLFVFLVKVGSFGTNPGEQYPRFTTGIALMLQMIHQGQFEFLLYPIGVIGNIVFPNNVTFASFFYHQAYLTIIFVVLELLFVYIQHAKLKGYLSVVAFNAIWLLVLHLLHTINPTHVSQLFAIAVGGQVVFITFLFQFIGDKKLQLLKIGLLISLLYILSFSMIYWLYTPYVLMDTTSRYMIMGSIGFAIWFSCFVTILLLSADDFFQSYISSHDMAMRNIIFSCVPFLIPILLLVIQVNSNMLGTRIYLNMLVKYRNQQLVDKTWNTLMKSVSSIDKNKQYIFYFTSDDYSSMYYAFIFGFAPHAALLDKDPNINTTPEPCVDYNQLVEYVKTGLPLKTVQGRKQEIVPINRIYAFDFRNEVLTNTTASIRKSLQTELTAASK